MKGLELSKKYFLTYGLPMLKEKFSDKLDKIAVGLVGHGSECFGFDDDLSTDHDFEPGFSIWLTDEDERDFGFKLFREYQKLPKEFEGIKIKEQSLFGSDAKGVHTISEFYKFYTGTGSSPTNLVDWLSIPEFYLAEATNGEVFLDNLGEFTKIRNEIINMPEDVRLKKLASSVFQMAQSGQYNYLRCMKHGEKTAASIALSEFVKHTAYAVYLFNHKHAPYYKWLFKGMKDLPILGALSADLEKLMESPYDVDNNTNIIESIALKVAEQIRKEDLSERTESYLEGYAYCINNCIKDGNLRTLPIIQ